jgi:hypothetical protein
MAPLILLFLALAYIDTLYTRYMLGRYGIGIELNPVIPWLIRKVGLANGVLVGVTVPTLLVLFLGIFFRPLLEGVTLARLFLFFAQASNLRNELALNPERPRAVRE